jgi:hypothetical protein
VHFHCLHYVSPFNWLALRYKKNKQIQKKRERTETLANIFGFVVKCRYVTLHLHLMLFELVKNSLRAVQERYMNSDKDVPPVRIIVADGEEDVTIKVVVLVITYRQHSSYIYSLMEVHITLDACGRD